MDPQVTTVLGVWDEWYCFRTKPAVSSLVLEHRGLKWLKDEDRDMYEDRNLLQQAVRLFAIKRDLRGMEMKVCTDLDAYDYPSLSWLAENWARPLKDGEPEVDIETWAAAHNLRRRPRTLMV